MITKEHKTEKICLFCANDYHLEMILLPYIKQKIENSDFIIFTESNLEESLNILLTKVNLSDEVKDKISNLDWKNNDLAKLQKLEHIGEKKINIIINGKLDYIKLINKTIKGLVNNSVKIIDCFHVGDFDVDIEEIKQEYSCVLNTQKL